MINFIYEDYISNVNICDELIQWYHANKKLHYAGLTGEKTLPDHKIKSSIDFAFNLSDIRKEMEIVDSYAEELQTILERYLLMYGYANWVRPFKIYEKVNIQHYKPYGGYREPHCERSGYKSTMHRHLVFQTYLNSVGDAGETEFFYQQYKCKAVKGKTLIWPVDWTHAHRGIISPTEDKYIITGWYSFD